MLLAALGTSPVQALARKLKSNGPVLVDYWRPWRESLETVEGRQFHVEHPVPPAIKRSPRPAYLLVSPEWIDPTGFSVFVALAPMVWPTSRPLSLRFRREGDGFVYCPRPPGQLECSK